MLGSNFFLLGQGGNMMLLPIIEHFDRTMMIVHLVRECNRAYCESASLLFILTLTTGKISAVFEIFPVVVNQ